MRIPDDSQDRGDSSASSSSEQHLSATSPLDESYHHISSSDLGPSLSATHPATMSGPLTTGPNANAAEPNDRKARLLYCKSHISIHPSNFSKDNISGYLAVVQVDHGGAASVSVDEEGRPRGGAGEEILVTWVPDEVLGRMSEGDREGYRRVERGGAGGGGGADAKDGKDEERDGFVFVSIPPPRGEKYAFSVPVSTIYSILVYPPSLSHWYGSATFNLTGGVSLPTLYFHDDESPLLASAPTVGQTPNPRSQWGFPPFISLLGTKATLLRSRLLAPRQNHGAELWLVNPSKSDRDVHEAGVDEVPPLSPVSPSLSGARGAGNPAGAGSAGQAGNASTTGSASGRERRRSSIPVGLFGAAMAVPNYPGPGSNSNTNDSIYPPEPQFPNSPLLGTNPKQSLLMGLSGITNLARRAAKEVLNTPLAQPVVPHLPPAMRSLVNAQGEWMGPGRSGSSGTAGAGAGAGRARGGGGRGRASDVAGEFESARLYLARWARVVAEEGERARKQEVAARRGKGFGEGGAGTGGDDGGGETTGLGVFSLLSSPNSRPAPAPTRQPTSPITLRDWESFAAQGRDEYYVRKEIFRRGFPAVSTGDLGVGEVVNGEREESEGARVRREGWEVLLGLISWGEGGVGGGEVGKGERARKRQEKREEKRGEYERLKEGWRGVVRRASGPVGRGQGEGEVVAADALKGGENEAVDAIGGTATSPTSTSQANQHQDQTIAERWKEEWHRIDVDCRRTDRNIPIYAVPAGVRAKGDEEKEGGGVPGRSPSGASGDWGDVFGLGKGTGAEEEEGSSASLNHHIAALRTILMTYHTYAPDLGYVQGMSDLLSPIYVVFGANEADAFWAFVGVMKMMESNFLRDQSGMKRQLSTLQKLIGVMDPELYAHLERTDSLNLFFCFRWILISFKREFAFDQVIRLWEVLWTNFYSDQFTLFVALAILQSHRDVLIRYLTEFDEVLKYANDLSGTIDLDTTLAQAEVLFLSFRSLVQDVNVEGEGKDEEGLGLRRRKGSGVAGEDDTGGDGVGLGVSGQIKLADIESLKELVRGWGDGRDEDGLVGRVKEMGI